MQVINTVITIGVAVLAVALITYAVGKVFMGMPQFATTVASQDLEWWKVMNNITINTQTAFSLLSISPLVLGVGLIISILIGAFAYMYVTGQ